MMAIIFVFGLLAGRVFFPHWHKTERFFTGVGIVAAWIASIGGIWMYVGHFDRVAVGVIILSLGALLFVPRKFFSTHEPEASPLGPPPFEQQPAARFGTEEKRTLPAMALLISLAIFVALIAHNLLQSKTTESIQSPWGVLPHTFFILIFLATLTMIALVRAGRSRLAFGAGLAFLFFIFSITLFVYPLGYGFDPFVHSATENYIAAHGTITPKPFSYLGQYALVLYMHYQTGVALPIFDRLLVPILLIFISLWALRRAMRHGLGLDGPTAGIATLLLPLMPFAEWIVTTPQGLGNVFALFALSLMIECKFTPSLPALVVSGAAVMIHPLAGVPVLILWTYTVLGALFKKLPRLVATILWIPVMLASAVALPFLFYLYGKLTGAHLWRIPTITNEMITSLIEKLPTMQTHFMFWHDAIYLYGKNIAIIMIIASLGAWIMLHKQKKSVGLLIAAATVTVVNALVLIAVIDFSYLPLAEQTGYAHRLMEVGALFLIPLVLYAIGRILITTDRMGRFLQIGTYALFAGLFTASVYLSYPHNDAYTIEHGWSVGAADVTAVYQINHDGGDVPYIVLANQSVSAVALREFGFKKYFPLTSDGKKTDAFYYSIPTGGPLYQYFNDASYGAPIRETVGKAMERAGVHRAYFVVNKYWYRSNKLIERAKLDADRWWDISDGRVFIFRFVK